MTATQASAASTDTSSGTTAWISGTNVIHLDIATCSGLDRMRSFGKEPEDTFAYVKVDQPSNLVGYRHVGDPTSLCRLCAVEAATEDVLRTNPLAPGERGVFVTFTISRPIPTDPADLLKYKKARARARIDTSDERSLELAIAAGDRLRRIAADAGLSVTPAVRGLAAYGFLPQAAIDQLAQVVRLEAKYTVDEMPTAQLVSTFWALVASSDVDMAPVEPETGQPHDPWYVAELINSTPEDV